MKDFDLEDIKKTFVENYDEVAKDFEEVREELAKIVKKHPWTALLSAVALGAGLAMVGYDKVLAAVPVDKDKLNGFLREKFGIDFRKFAHSPASVVSGTTYPN